VRFFLLYEDVGVVWCGIVANVCVRCCVALQLLRTLDNGAPAPASETEVLMSKKDSLAKLKSRGCTELKVIIPTRSTFCIFL
jgi:hypothetical protein